MKIVLNDINIERTILGCMQVQIQFRKEGTDETAAWQMPFKIGQSVEKVVGELHEFAEMIRKANREPGADLEAMKEMLRKRDCPTKSEGLE